MTVFTDEFYQISASEAFKKSRCMEHEHNISQLFASMLLNLGYQRIDNHTWRHWAQHKKTVIVCLVDDFTTCRTDYSQPITKCFDPNTVIITDNRMLVDTQYSVLTLPHSYIGTFSYPPDPVGFAPDKRFSFSVHRLDHQRALILLELVAQSGGVNNWLQLDHVNFNCYDPDGHNNTSSDLQHNFITMCNDISVHFPEYLALATQLTELMPIRTHNWSIERAHVSAYLTLVLETYSGDNVITFSEKTTRALLTPAPWALFGCFGAVDWLANLGFDVLADIVDHDYNKVRQEPSYRGIEKIRAYITSCVKIYQNLASMDQNKLRTRCEQAARHNYQRLAELQHQWPGDFANWLPMAIDKIAGK